MRAAIVLAREALRGRWSGLVALALVLAVGLGVGLTSLEIAHRTESAYPDYLKQADAAELVVNPSMVTADTEALLRSIPGVESITSDVLLTAAVDGLETELSFLQARVSADGRYVTQDRPVVLEGRMIRSGAEAFLSVEAAEAVGVEVGETLPLTFYSEAIEPIRSVEPRVVGIGLFPDEALPDELFPRQKMLVTDDVAADLTCLQPTPAADDPRSLEELFAAFFPPDCSQSYQYFSLRVAGGDAGALEVAEELAARFHEENQRLPAALQEADFGYELIASFSDQDAEEVRDSLAPVVTSLRAFGAAACLATLGVALLLALRLMRRREGDTAVWRSLGLTGVERSVAVGLPLAATAVLGLAGAWLGAWAASVIGPIASAERLVPDPSRGLGSTVTGALLVATVLLFGGLVLGARSAANSPTRIRRGSTVTRPWLNALSGRPPLALGVRAAVRGPGAGALLVGVVSAVAAVTATLVFSTSLVRFVDTPSRFGWPYEVAYLVGAGYGQAHLDEVAATLDHPDVEAWGLANMAGGLSVDGESLPFISGRGDFEQLEGGPVVIEGRAPRGADEIALGAVSAADLDLGIGDDATITTEYGEHDARVTGFVVLPALGPLESDRMALGSGAWLPAAAFEAASSDAEERTGQTPAEIADGLSGLVVVDLAPGVDREEFLADVHDEAFAWDPFQSQPLEYAEPVRPPTVIDVASMRRVPLSLAGAFVFVMAVSVVAGIAAGTRARRRELSIVRSIGGTRRQRRASVRRHALTVVGVGLVFGLPIGVAIGRAAFAAFADDIGVSPEPAVSLLLLLSVAVGAVLLGLLAAALSSPSAASPVLAPDSGAGTPESGARTVR